MKRLSDLKLSPIFYGITELNGRIHFVSELIFPSIIVKPTSMTSSSKQVDSLNSTIERNKLIQSWKTEIQKIRAILNREKIIPEDIQFLLTPDGNALLIDPDFYKEVSQGEGKDNTNINKIIDGFDKW
jgi:hypothetical protein